MSSRFNKIKGEVSIDNRASGNPLEEFWTFTCAHCGTIRYVNPASNRLVRMRVIRKMPENKVVEVTWQEFDPPTACRKCMAYLCDHPACHKECLPVKAGIHLIAEKGTEVDPFNVDERSRFDLHNAYDTQRIF